MPAADTLVAINTDSAPAALGPYSQAIVNDGWVYISGQIGLDPKTAELSGSDFLSQARQVFANLSAIASEAGASLGDAVKLNIYLESLENFQALNELMADTLSEPYPARACVEVSALPRGALVEIDAVLALAK